MLPFTLTVVIVTNFVVIGLLPVLFFRRDGRFNLRWFATGAPFFVAPVAIALAYAGIVDVPRNYVDVALATEGLATLTSLASIGLIAMTVGVHRVPLALWHQDNDEPVELVTWGPYAYVRHPFYTSFLLAFLAAAIALPHLVTLGCFAYAGIALSMTAAREERRLAASVFGASYSEYMTATGRFFPRRLS